MNRKLVRLVALVACVGFAACGESTDLILDELSEVEAQEMAGALMATTFSSTSAMPQQPAPAPGGPQAVPFAYASEFEGQVDCALGGSVGVAASFEANGDTEGQASHVEYSMTQIHDGCVVNGENGGVFTLWGAPSMTLAFAVDNNGQGVIEWGGSIEGAIEWVTEGRTGTCEVVMEFSGRQEGDAQVTAGLIGTICGFSVDHELSVG